MVWKGTHADYPLAPVFFYSEGLFERMKGKLKEHSGNIFSKFLIKKKRKKVKRKLK